MSTTYLNWEMANSNKRDILYHRICMISYLLVLLNETLKDPFDVGFNVNKVSV